MPPISPKRLRMITFRVTDQEYESLKTLYPAAGARSVSEFARVAIERLLHEDGAAPVAGDRIEDIESRLGVVSREVARLSRAVDRARERRGEEREGVVNA